MILGQIAAALPLFALVFAGYLLQRLFEPPRRLSELLTRLVFTIGLPAMLFRMMSDLSTLPEVDTRLLIAFFGGGLATFAIGRVLAHLLFALDGVSQSVFALGGIFSNNVLLGVPLAAALLGEAALQPVALVLVFNSLILWTLVTVSVEWARHGALSLPGFGRTLRGVLSNPIIIAIVGGTLFGLAGLRLPAAVDLPLTLLARAAVPVALFALGLALAGYRLRTNWRQTLAICSLKLLINPLVVWLLAALLGLPALETQVVVMLASLAVGVNVYLMSRQFRALEGPVAASLVLSTAASALTTPLLLALVQRTL